MADRSFGVKDINLIGASGTPTIESPNSLTISATNVAISTDITVGGMVSLGAGTSISSPGSNILTFGTNSTERLRIESGGTVTVGYRATPGSTSTPARLSLSGDYSSSAGQNPKFDVWASSTDYMSLGVSSNQMDFMMSRDDYDYVWYGRNDADNGPEERMRIDNGEKTLDFPSSAKIRLQGSQNHGQRLAHINIGSDGGSSTDTRAIDIWGNWQDQESKSITYNHGSTTTNMVAQQRVRYNSTPSSTYYEIGRFYHGQDTSAYPIRFVSTSTTTANLELDGNLKVSSGNGIDFSANANASGMSSELLDDYEEGSFTPAWGDGSSAYSSPAPTYSNQRGDYTKIGNVVYYDIHLTTTAWNGAGGTLWAHGLPFATRSSGYQQGGGGIFCIQGVDSASAISSLTTQIAPNTTRLEMYFQTAGTGANYNGFGTNHVNEGGTVDIRINGFYYTNS